MMIYNIIRDLKHYVVVIILLVMVISTLLPLSIINSIKLAKQICKQKTKCNYLVELRCLKAKIKGFYNQLYQNNNSSSIEITTNKNSYNDAVCAFNNINNDLFGIRNKQYATVTPALMKSISIGKEVDINLDKFSDKERENITLIISKINQFNRDYRSHILAYLQIKGLQWENCVRFPENKLYNPDWDEDILGNTVEKGAIIQRVVQLGFEFPDSIILGRIKSKVIAE